MVDAESKWDRGTKECGTTAPVARICLRGPSGLLIQATAFAALAVLVAGAVQEGGRRVELESKAAEGAGIAAQLAAARRRGSVAIVPAPHRDAVALLADSEHAANERRRAPREAVPPSHPRGLAAVSPALPAKPARHWAGDPRADLRGRLRARSGGLAGGILGRFNRSLTDAGQGR